MNTCNYINFIILYLIYIITGQQQCWHLLRTREIDIQTIRNSIIFSCQGHSIEITKKLISIGRLYWLWKGYKYKVILVR